MLADLPAKLFDGDDWFAESPSAPRRSANLSPCICDLCFSDDDEAERSFHFWQVSVASAGPGDAHLVVVREHRSRDEVAAALEELDFDPSGCEWVGAGDSDSTPMGRLNPSAN